MPRRTITADSPIQASAPLVDQLAGELRTSQESGQPLIYEQTFPTGKLRVTVIWDAWDRLPLEQRTEIILRAYAQAEGRDSRDRIALASGLTVPEAYAAGMLPFQIFPALRKGDSVSPEECRAAMIAEGASILAGSERPQLRFATLDEAEAAQKRLSQRLPLSEPVWAITQEFGKVEDWLER